MDRVKRIFKGTKWGRGPIQREKNGWVPSAVWPRGRGPVLEGPGREGENSPLRESPVPTSKAL